MDRLWQVLKILRSNERFKGVSGSVASIMCVVPRQLIDG